MNKQKKSQVAHILWVSNIWAPRENLCLSRLTQTAITPVKKSVAASRQLCSSSSFRLLERHSTTGISTSKDHSFGPANGHRHHKKNLKTFYCARLAYYILEAIEESLLTSSSTAREVSAKFILQAVIFVADGEKYGNVELQQVENY